MRIQAGDKLKNVVGLPARDKQESQEARGAEGRARGGETRKEGMPVSRFRQLMAEKAEARAAGVKKIVKPKAKA